jgi:tryptophan synthase alpha chain
MPLRFTNRPALVAYITCGDPDLGATREVVLAAAAGGAEVVELGVPFSDPVADGPVIQRASERALRNRVSLGDVLRLARDIRRETATGLIVFSYLNPLLRMGIESFAATAAGEYCREMRRRGLATIFLAAPTSTEARLRRIAEASTGFVYAVSRTGVTGRREEFPPDAEKLVRRLRRHTQLPIAVGFGISAPAQVRAVGGFADAAVVGSAIVEKIEANRGREAQAVAEFVEQLLNRKNQPLPRALARNRR